MKEDFTHAKEELARIGIVRVAIDFYSMPKRQGAYYFVKSPATHDKTWSCALYPGSNRFCDFANGNLSGDCIAFVAYIQGCNQWQALQALKDFYGLSGSGEGGGGEVSQKIVLQQERERKKKERRKEFETALLARIDSLKCWENIYRTSIEKCLYEPFSDMWVYCIEEQQKTAYQLDILCAIGSTEFMRMKSNAELGLSSDRYQWILDVLEILAEQGAFAVTMEEKREIEAQRDFELQRKPKADRRCGIEW